MKFFTLNLVLIIALYGCVKDSNEQKIDTAINDLIHRFPQLPRGKNKQIDYYKLVRSVTNGAKGFQIQLRSCPDSIKDPQQIIIIGNSQGEYCAIPFLSNTYRDYWNFQYDSIGLNVKKTNSTFENEYNNALKYLQLIDTLKTAPLVSEELFLTLLRCEILNEGDSILLTKYTYCTDNFNLPVDSDEDYKLRMNKIYKAISSEWNLHHYCSLMDNTNNRIYQFDCNELRSLKMINLSVKVYRTDKVEHRIYYHM